MPEAAIRPALASDAQAVCDIYAFHVAHSTATFDTVAPDAATWAEKIAAVSSRGWPFLVAARDGAVLGYCYATQFRDRAAYARPTWRLMQATVTGASPVRFGVVGGMDRPDQLAAVVSWQGRSRPTGVRVVMRDHTVAPRPWLSHDLPPAAQRRWPWC